MWPDTEAAIGVFVSMATQWRVGMNGATGLDYAALPAVLRFRGVPRSDHTQTFDDVRVMESHTLHLMRKDK